MGCTSKKINTNFKNRHVKSEHYFKNYHGNELKSSVLLVADNQFNNMFQDPSIMRNNMGDYISRVAIRPPQLDIYAKELFMQVLENNNAENKYVIHLGDALNIACKNEWQDFQNALSSVDKNKFVMAPGNHDFYWFGTTAGYTESIKLQWGKSCSNVYNPIKENKPTNEQYLSMRMTKGKFIDSYLNLINKKVDIKKDFINNSKDSFVKKIYQQRYLGEEDDYKSFIVQLIDIPTKGKKPIKGIVIDTSTYNKKPLNFYGAIGSVLKLSGSVNPGMTAGITAEQFNKITDWIKKFDKTQQYIVFGHHPLKSFHNETKNRIEKILNNENALGYISGHTHLGFVHDGNNTDAMEVNVGSVTDYPNEIRTLETTQQNKLVSKSILIAPYDLQSKYCAAKYDYTASFPNYTSYELSDIWKNTAHDTHEKILNISIETYIRLFHDLKIANSCTKELEHAKNILNKDKFGKPVRCKGNSYSKTNKKCRKEKLIALKKLNTCSNLMDDKFKKELQLYGACQSLWASKAEWIKNNTK